MGASLPTTILPPLSPNQPTPSWKSPALDTKRETQLTWEVDFATYTTEKTTDKTSEYIPSLNGHPTSVSLPLELPVFDCQSTTLAYFRQFLQKDKFCAQNCLGLALHASVPPSFPRPAEQGSWACSLCFCACGVCGHCSGGLKIFFALQVVWARGTGLSQGYNYLHCG